MIGSILSALIFSSPSDPSPSLCQVNPITKEQHNALGTSYRKVPLMMADGVELVESSVIISLLHSHFTTGIKYKRTSYTFLSSCQDPIFSENPLFEPVKFELSTRLSMFLHVL